MARSLAGAVDESLELSAAQAIAAVNTRMASLIRATASRAGRSPGRRLAIRILDPVAKCCRRPVPTAISRWISLLIECAQVANVGWRCNAAPGLADPREIAVEPAACSLATRIEDANRQSTTLEIARLGDAVAE